MIILKGANEKMPYSYNIDMEVGCVFVKAWGKISNQELIAYINQMYNSKYCQHFYYDEEINKLKTKWGKNSLHVDK